MRTKAIILTAGMTSLLTSCTPAPAEPGISSSEARVLKASYYWDKSYGPFRDQGDSLERLMDDTPRRMAGGGERSEGQMSALILALATVGDARFSRTLEARPPRIRREVLEAVSPAWEHDRLSYPLTRAMAAKAGIRS